MKVVPAGPPKTFIAGPPSSPGAGGREGSGEEGRGGEGSITAEFRLALRDVGVQTLAGVRALEELLLELPLDGEAALEGDLGAGLHRALDPAHRLGRLVRRAELLGVLVDLTEEVVAVENRVDDADPLRLLEVDQAAGDHQLDRLALAHPAGQAWAMEQFKSFGCQNVHLEKWGEWAVGFDRARTGHVGRMTSPTTREFQFTTPSWTPGTKGLQKGKAVMEPADMDEFNKNKGSYRGAWMIMRPRPAGGGGGRPAGGNPATPTTAAGGAAAGGGAAGAAPAQDPAVKAREDLADAVAKSGIKGQVSGSRTELVVTGGNYNITWDKLPKMTRVTIRKSDFDAVMKAMESGTVELEFNLNQSFRKGPITINNVIAEIPGTDKPDEVVIVSGHFDSWDGPMSQGALDNGTGSCVTLECARILGTLGVKPKRTIRFILWSGEEQGLFGSRGYVKDHAAEMDKISAVLVDDGGTNYWGGFVGLATQESYFKSSMDALNEAFPTLPMTWTSQATMPRGGGSDHASFNAVGVPGFFTKETGVSDYNYVHHTQHDRLEAAINAYLVQSSTAAAVTSYNLSCADAMLPRGPKPSGSN